MPSFEADLKAREVNITILASPFSSAAFKRAGKQSFINSACAKWFIANWISYPSFETPVGIAMTPALQTRISSSLPDFSRNVFAAWTTEEREVWSQGMKVILFEKEGREVMREVAAWVLRPVK